jgi:hypothetical protein
LSIALLVFNGKVIGIFEQFKDNLCKSIVDGAEDDNKKSNASKPTLDLPLKF